MGVCEAVCIFVVMSTFACPVYVKQFSEPVCVCVLPPDGHSQCLRGAGAGTDDLASQPFSLKDVEEGVAGGDGPCQPETPS